MNHTYRKSSFARRRAKLRRYRFILFVILIAVSVISIWHCFQKLSELISLAETAHAQTGAENSPTLFSILQEGKDDSNSSSSNLPYYSADEAYRIAWTACLRMAFPPDVNQSVPFAYCNIGALTLPLTLSFKTICPVKAFWLKVKPSTDRIQMNPLQEIPILPEAWAVFPTSSSKRLMP